MKENICKNNYDDTLPVEKENSESEQDIKHIQLTQDKFATEMKLLNRSTDKAFNKKY